MDVKQGIDFRKLTAAALLNTKFNRTNSIELLLLDVECFPVSVGGHSLYSELFRNLI